MELRIKYASVYNRDIKGGRRFVNEVSEVRTQCRRNRHLHPFKDPASFQ